LLPVEAQRTAFQLETQQATSRHRDAFAAAHAPKRVLRRALPTLRSAGRPRRRALPSPVRRDRSSSLTAAPAPVRRMKVQDCSRSFSASPLSPPCPGNVASNVSTATRLRWGRFGRLARLSPTWLAFAALTRLRGL
jgi:hypothetical protein